MHFSLFIRSDGAYIEQWLTMKGTIKFPPDKAKEDDPAMKKIYHESSIEYVLVATPFIMNTVEVLLKLEMDIFTLRSLVAIPAMTMALRDLSLFLVALQSGVVRLLDLYFNLNVRNAAIALGV